MIIKVYRIKNYRVTIQPDIRYPAIQYPVQPYYIEATLLYRSNAIRVSTRNFYKVKLVILQPWSEKLMGWLKDLFLHDNSPDSCVGTKGFKLTTTWKILHKGHNNFLLCSIVWQYNQFCSCLLLTVIHIACQPDNFRVKLLGKIYIFHPPISDKCL